MIAIFDSTVFYHLYKHGEKMNNIIIEHGIKEFFITRINYLEILSGAAENSKLQVKKSLDRFKILEFDGAAVSVANKLARNYRVSAKNSKDFLIAAIAISNKFPLLTENDKDFNYAELNVLPYRIKLKK